MPSGPLYCARSSGLVNHCAAIRSAIALTISRSEALTVYSVVVTTSKPTTSSTRAAAKSTAACAAGSSFVEIVRCRWFSRSVTVTSPPSTGTGIVALHPLCCEERLLGDDVRLVVADLHAGVDVDRDAERGQSQAERQILADRVLAVLRLLEERERLVEVAL